MWSIPFLDSLFGAQDRSSSLKTLSVQAAPWSLPLPAIFPGLANLTRLRSLELSGLVGDWTAEEHIGLFSRLESLTLYDPTLTSEVFLKLCLPKDKTFTPTLKSLDLTLLPFDDPAVPTPDDFAVLEVLKTLGISLLHLAITRRWSGSLGGNPYFGRQALDACGPHLCSLKLRGEIFEASLLRSDHRKQIEALELEWCAVISYGDLSEALASLDHPWPKLRSLQAHSTGYDEDFGVKSIAQLRRASEEKKIECTAGTRLGSVFFPLQERVPISILYDRPWTAPVRATVPNV